jgi:hypothetical protein
LAAAASSARAEEKAQPKQAEAKQSAEAKKEEKKASRGKRFLRSVGSFSAGMVVTDPYSEGRAARKSAR